MSFTEAPAKNKVAKSNIAGNWCQGMDMDLGQGLKIIRKTISPFLGVFFPSLNVNLSSVLIIMH